MENIVKLEDISLELFGLRKVEHYLGILVSISIE